MAKPDLSHLSSRHHHLCEQLRTTRCYKLAIAFDVDIHCLVQAGG